MQIKNICGLGNISSPKIRAYFLTCVSVRRKYTISHRAIKNDLIKTILPL